MSDRSNIEWTDATWNPVTGCTKVSPGCDHCYAETLAERFRGTPGHYYERGFDVQLRPEKLDQPLRWKRPRRVFVNSMSDLFHEAIPDEYIARVWAVMARASQHTFQVLTKRHGRMRSLLKSEWFEDQVGAQDGVTHLPRWPLPNVWMGVSAEDQKWADVRIPALLDTPAVVRFVSAEPLLGPIDFDTYVWEQTPKRPFGRALDWVIVGGESGRGARPMHPDWPRPIRDECQAAEVSFHFKQWGEWAPAGLGIRIGLPPKTIYEDHVRREHWFPGSPDPRFTHTVVRRVGKKFAGRELDGRTWDEFPAAAHV